MGDLRIGFTEYLPSGLELITVSVGCTDLRSLRVHLTLKID
jgi:hypothetical protein